MLRYRVDEADLGIRHDRSWFHGDIQDQVARLCRAWSHEDSPGSRLDSKGAGRSGSVGKN